MATSRPKADLNLSKEERDQLMSFARSHTLPSALAARAKVILWSAADKSNSEIAERLSWTRADGGQVAAVFLGIPYGRVVR